MSPPVGQLVSWHFQISILSVSVKCECEPSWSLCRPWDVLIFLKGMTKTFPPKQKYIYQHTNPPTYLPTPPAYLPTYYRPESTSDYFPGLQRVQSHDSVQERALPGAGLS